MSQPDTRGITAQEKDIAPQPTPDRSNTASEQSPSPSCSRWCTAPWKSRSSWSRWLADDIPVENAVPNLIMQAFATGVLDATTYADYKTFASNQTGNTILLAVSVAGTVEVLLMLTAISLGSFLLCAGIFGHLGHFMGPRRRSWLLLTSLLQLSSLLIALLFLSIGPASLRVGGRHEWAVLALFAGMSGAQVACARQSGSAEMPTAPMTSSYVDLVADKYLFVSPTHPNAGGRNKRLVYVAVMWAGALLGAVVHAWGGSWEVVLLTMGLKGVGLGFVFVAGGERREREQGPEEGCVR